MDFIPHGGYCCGMRHLRGFGSPKATPYSRSSSTGFRKAVPQAETNEEEFDAIMDYANKTQNTKCIEVVLNDGQILRYPEWVKKLKDNDFRLVTRFNNSEQSWCNVFHKVVGGNDYRDNDIPNWWKD